MHYLIRSMLSIVGTCAAGISGAAFGAIPEMSQERMQEISSHIFLAKVVRIYSTVDRASSSNWEVTHSVAELQLQKVEKGKHDFPLAYVRFETKRSKNQEPGDMGHRGIPKAGEITRVFVFTAKDGGYDVLPPNGFTAAAKQK